RRVDQLAGADDRRGQNQPRPDLPQRPDQRPRGILHRVDRRGIQVARVALVRLVAHSADLNDSNTNADPPTARHPITRSPTAGGWPEGQWRSARDLKLSFGSLSPRNSVLR